MNLKYKWCGEQSGRQTNQYGLKLVPATKDWF